MNAIIAVSLLLTAASPKEEVSKPLKTVVNSVRYGKDLIALKNFAGDEQGKLLCGDAWAKGTDAQRAEFQKLFLELFGKMAFPKIRDSFKNLDTVLYDEPTLEGDKAKISSTILINHPMKKQELKVTYDLVKAKAGYQVVDVTVKGGSSMLTDIRDDQVQPLIKEGGWDGLLKAMRDKSAELKDVQLK
ncbi:MAG: ABC transporter substrate-binding protein [Archangiaceae bacterium]|nr:ABC transporter substrate-binding protein [Archangiaceae bacterium]